MEGQDILATVEVIQKEKEKKKKEAESGKKSKERLEELFYKCKSKCFCVGPCNAKGLKECPNCHSIMKPTCSKTASQVAGRKLVMICPALSTVVSTSKKQKQVKKKFFDNKEEDSSFLEETSGSSEESAGEESSDNEVVDESKRTIATIHGAWKAISPQTKKMKLWANGLVLYIVEEKFQCSIWLNCFIVFWMMKMVLWHQWKWNVSWQKWDLGMFYKLLHFTYHMTLPFFHFKMSSQDHY